MELRFSHATRKYARMRDVLFSFTGGPPMLRTTTRQRGATSSPSAVELLDRTGIIAASLPQRRRRAGEVPEPMPIYTRPPVCDQDLRPKSVVIRRRVRAWLGSGAAVLLIGLGWVAGASLGGGMLTPPADEVAQVEPNSAAAEPQPAPQLPAVVVQPQAPVTVYVPVPEHKASPKRVQAQPKVKPESDVPRVDLPPAPAPQAKPVDPVAQLLQPWVNAA